jgi:hypothetical protein
MARITSKTLCAVALLCCAPGGTSFILHQAVPVGSLRREYSRQKARKHHHDSISYAGTTRHASKSSDTGTSNVASTPGWHRRVLKSVFRRPLEMKVDAEVSEQLIGVFNAPEDFITANFESKSLLDLSPLEPTLLPNSRSDSLWGVPKDLSLEVEGPSKSSKQTKRASSSNKDGTKIASSEPGGSPGTRVARVWYQNIITDLLDRWSKGSHVNLKVKCEPTPMSLFRGHIRCDACVDFDRIIFGAIRVSGGRLEAHRLAVNLWSFTPDTIPAAPPRFPNQFDFVASNITFTQEDLFESRCIRNGLSNLLRRILKQAGVSSSTVSINSIEILPTNKIAIRGEATTLFGASVPFQVRSGLSTSGRGHILTFPGLEMALGTSTVSFFVPVLPPVTLDLGHNAQLLDVEVDGVSQQLRVSAKATITPSHTRILPNYIQSRGSFAASHMVDVGRWLTNLGNFSYS